MQETFPHINIIIITTERGDEMKKEALKLAVEIIRLDLIRDEMLEELIVLAGTEAYEILRKVQNTT
jgi:hypothetical protein